MEVAALREPVARLITETADALIRPRFRQLRESDVEEKSPGELVTVADREAEARLTEGLCALTPDVPVVGEEAAAADPSVVQRLATDRCWLVDPLDGTANFVDGSPDYAVMVCLIERGAPVGAWVWQPEHSQLWTAARGAGTSCNGRPVTTASSRSGPDHRLAVLSRFLDAPTRATVDRHRHRFVSVEEGPRCAGVTYPALIEKRFDAVLFWRTLPWDHAPGVLLLTESGGAARRLDGSPYVVGDERAGLLCVTDDSSWSDMRAALLDDDPQPSAIA